MIYGIQSKNDFLTGASLTVRIPEEELDKKALYTIQKDRPGFILPFRFISIEKQIEFVYQIGTHSKLQYLSGSRSPEEYASLWTSILCPLLECGDWFMRPYSFLLSADYLFCDKNKQAVSYVYIPSVRECSDYDALKKMAAEISKLITVSDANMENKVLRAIMKEFDPNGFLQMLKSYIHAGAPPAEPYPVSEHQPVPVNNNSLIAPHNTSEQVISPVHENKRGQLQEPRDTIESAPGDIFINIPAGNAPVRKKAGVSKEAENTGYAKEKEPVKAVNISNFFGKKKETQQELLPVDAPVQHGVHDPVFSSTPVNIPPTEPNDDTQIISEISGGTRFRLVGSILLPAFIEVLVREGEVFTIGRYDASAGRKQSDFEFDKKTKAVSRRHAAIERCAECYNIIDLASSAGTFVNGQRLPPNTPYELVYGCRVSFGNAGADYVWEE